MGNCLVLHEKKPTIRVRRTEETKLTNPTSLKVDQVLFKRLGFEISVKRLRAVQKLNAVGVMRIKLVLTKQELIEMTKNGGVSIGGAIKPGLFSTDQGSRSMGTEEGRSLARNHVLESIPEVE